MMKMRSYLKEKTKKVELETFTDDVVTVDVKHCNRKKTLFSIIMVAIVVPAVIFGFTHTEVKNIEVSELDTIQLSSMPIAATSVSKGVISIPTGTVKANPFLPYRDLGEVATGADVPSASLVEPPEMVDQNSDAARVMDTIVSGILYDKFSPSAILNIEGNDYLVKKGDTVNNYKVLNILQDSVTVKLGENVYKAGIGEILTEGSLNHNDVSNLSNKFGGVNNELQ